MTSAARAIFFILSALIAATGIHSALDGAFLPQMTATPRITPPSTNFEFPVFSGTLGSMGTEPEWKLAELSANTTAQRRRIPRLKRRTVAPGGSSIESQRMFVLYESQLRAARDEVRNAREEVRKLSAEHAQTTKSMEEQYNSSMKKIEDEAQVKIQSAYRNGELLGLFTAILLAVAAGAAWVSAIYTRKNAKTNIAAYELNLASAASRMQPTASAAPAVVPTTSQVAANANAAQEPAA